MAPIMLELVCNWPAKRPALMPQLAFPFKPWATVRVTAAHAFLYVIADLSRKGCIWGISHGLAS